MLFFYPRVTRYLFMCIFFLVLSWAIFLNSAFSENLITNPDRFNNFGGWGGKSGMNLSLTEEKTEENILKVWGEQRTGWDYLELKLDNAKLKPNIKYRFQGLIKVSSLSHLFYPPFFKIVFKNKDGQLLKPHYTNKYDILDLNTWQKFSTEFEITENEVDGVLLLAKGSNTTINVDLYIKNVSLHEISEYTAVERQNFKNSPIKLPDSSSIHPRLFVNDEKINFIKGNLKNKPYNNYWKFVEQKAIQYSKETPPNSIEGYTDPQCMILGDKLPYIAFAYLLTGDDSYLQGVIKWMDKICSYKNWSSNNDIGAAHILQGLAISYDWIYDKLPTKTRETCLQKIGLQADILYLCLVNQEQWWATDYLQNHNYVNVMSIAIAGLSIFNEEEKAESWLVAANSNFGKILNLLSPDGASHEGVQYWSYGTDALLKYFIGMSPVFGEDDLLTNLYFQNTALFRLHASLPDFKDNVDYADSPRFEVYGPGHILRALARLFKDGTAQWLANQIEKARGKNTTYNWLDLIWYDETISPEPPDNLSTSIFLKNLGIFIYRTDWTEKSPWIFFKAGPPQGHLAYEKGFYTGSHIHPDAGNFLLWAEGKWVIIDDGYVYKKWSRNHNVLLLNGYGQLGEGEQWFNKEAYGRHNGNASIVFLEIQKNYTYIVARLEKIYPPEANLKLWERTLIILPDNHLIVRDDVRLHDKGQIESYLHFGDGNLKQVDNYYSFQNNDTYMSIINIADISMRSGISKYTLPENEILNVSYCNRNSQLLRYFINESEEVTNTFLFSSSSSNNKNDIPTIKYYINNSKQEFEFMNFSAEVNYLDKHVSITFK